MYFDLSLKKLTPLLLLAGIFTFGIAGFTYANTRLHMVERSWQLLVRSAYNTQYTLRYKTPNLAAALALSMTGQTSSPTTTSLETGNAEAIPVLLYHGTPSEGTDNPPLPQSIFTEQLHALYNDGWRTVTLEQFESFMKDGTPLPAKSFLLTFDDGRAESFYPADPVLRDLGYSAVMFVITGFSIPNGSDKSTNGFYLDKSELRYLVSSGRWELQSHGDQDHRLYAVPNVDGTASSTIPDQHFLSNLFWVPKEGRVETHNEYLARVTQDLKTSKQQLEDAFGKPITAFAFPFSDYGQNSANNPTAIADLSNIVSSLYSYAFYQVSPTRDDPFNYPDKNTYLIKRIEPAASWSGADLVSILNQNRPKSLPYQNDASWTAWSSNWGSVTAQNANLLLSATTTTTGATAVLNGSREWDNYTTTTQVHWYTGSDLSLIARYVADTHTYLSCAFSKNRIALKLHEDGQQKTLATANYVFTADPRRAPFSMSTHGSEVTCTAPGGQLTETVPTRFVHPGSVGIQIWDVEKDKARLEVLRASVKKTE